MLCYPDSIMDRLMQMVSAQTNLTGTANCLDAARRHQADVMFLSTSRVYPIAGLRALPLSRCGSRLDVPKTASGTGCEAMYSV